MDATTGAVLTSVVASIVAASASLTKLFADIYRENRKRAWEQEDRRLVADELAATVAWQHAELKDAIKENTVSTEQAITVGQAAFKEANEVNGKLAAQNGHIERLAQAMVTNGQKDK